MRYRLRFTAENDFELEANYNLNLANAIRRLINPKYLEFLDGGGFLANGRVYKPYTFSRLLPERYLIENSKFKIFSGYVDLVVSSIDENFSFFFLEGLLREKGILIYDFFLNLSSIFVIKKRFKNILFCKTLSPVIIKEAQVNFEEGEFNNEIFISSIKKNLIAKSSAFKKINIFFDEVDIEVLEPQKVKNRFLIIKGEKYIGYDLKLRIEGPKEAVDVAYSCGIGAKNALGFGCLEHLKRADEAEVYRI